MAKRAVVIGGSLGGLDALCGIVAALPSDFPAPMLVVIHSGPGSPRLMAEILAYRSSIPASYANDNEPIEAGQIYFAPPDCHLTVQPPGVLRLDHRPKVRHSRPAADVLFKSAANFYGSDLVAVVLTGGDHDGTDGLRTVHAAGGTAVVQSPSTARNPEMPHNAIAGDHPDFCVALEDIAPLLVRLVCT